MNKLKKWMSIILTITLLCTTLLSTNMIVKASLLPLKEVKAYLVVGDHDDVDISAVPIELILNSLRDSNGNLLEINKNAQIVWCYCKDRDGSSITDDYYILKDGGTIDLSIYEGYPQYTLEMIVGDGHQLNPDNVRYSVTVYLSDEVMGLRTYELYKQDADGTRHKIVPDDQYVTSSTLSGMRASGRVFVVPDHVDGTEYYIGINDPIDEHPFIQCDVMNYADYLGFMMGQTLGFEYKYTNLADKFINVDMTKTDAGYKNNWDVPEVTEDSYDITKTFALLYKDAASGEVLASELITFIVSGEVPLFEDDAFDVNSSTSIKLTTTHHVSVNEIKGPFELTGDDATQIRRVILNEGYPADAEYCYSLYAKSPTWENANDHVIKATVGWYDTLEDASVTEDISNQLLPKSNAVGQIGYKANYNIAKGGVPVTIFFDDNSIYKFLIVFQEYDKNADLSYVREFTEKPIIGEADPWLRVTGATDCNGRKYDTYAIENGKNCNMDTYYGYGYQTIFINDKNEDVDLSSIKPEFWYANTDRVYAISKDSGNRVDENHTRDFNNENQQYTGVIINNNKENERNYWITFKKLNKSGPELYVYGPSEREVILDEYFEFKHDILIANIGNAPLEDISVELLEAENVKLDPYWNVGGNGNNTLAPFTTTSSDAKYGELPNIAKIRLLPDGDGEVKGTLKISAEGQKPVLIRLNGTAQKPDIINEKLRDAVKYVPYQQIVATNNIHDWITTKFSKVDGFLPEGLELNEDTGEIYGIPTGTKENEEITYKFTVEARYLVDGQEGYFEPSRKEFTLTVKPNTDKNVYLASDSGYSIKRPIGTKIGEYSYELDSVNDKTIFTSNGEYGEFFGLYLNGEKLEKDKDYDSESGSTVITIKKQTMEGRTKPGENNTIAMEFRKDTDGDGKGDSGAKMMRTSQNFSIRTETDVDNVIKKINALPSDIKLTDKEIVQSVRKAFDSLSPSDQTKVSNIKKLKDAEETINKLEKIENDKKKIDDVKNLISSIPDSITLEDKQQISKARKAYDDLSEDQRKLVTNFSRLTRAESAIIQLEQNEKDRSAANEVVTLINNLPNSITIDSKDAVITARNAYNILSASQKEYVINYDKLQKAEKRILELEAKGREQAKINAVISAIDAIPENLTLSDKSIVEAARIAYNTLTDLQKKKVVNIDKLKKAENTIDALEAQENASKADRAAAQEVIELINELPKETNLADKSTIEAARVAYEKLTNKQKKLVTNYGDLTEAEAVIKALEDYEVANKKDQVAADEVINLINAIPSDITLDDKAIVETARNAYNALNENQKKIVINYKTLIDAEVIIAKIENDNYKEIKSITFVGILVDEDGKALVDRIVEIHSVVQTGRTDENGSFQFNSVEFGKHIIFIKDDNGNIIAQREFNIIQGSPLSLKGNDVIAENGSIFTIKMQLDNDKLTFLNVEEGNKAPAVNIKKDIESIYIGENNVIMPKTGDDNNIILWIILLVASLFGLIITANLSYKQRKYINGYGRV